MGFLSSSSDLVCHRLINQKLINSDLKTPAEVVRWLGAVQAQEYAMAKWSLALRLTQPTTDADVERIFNEGKILRTHLHRPTWHFVIPEDIRWMLALCSERLHNGNGTMYRQLGLTSAKRKKATDTIARALQGGNQLTRQAILAELKKVRLNTESFRLGYYLMSAELDGVICSGSRQGKQFTYALLEERVPAKQPSNLSRNEAIAKLALRYFDSRGPATIQDFATWSSMTLKDAAHGANSLPKEFTREKFDGKEYFFKARDFEPFDLLRATFLMPDYDEYGMGYKDRSAIFNDRALKRYQQKRTSAKSKNPIFNRMIIVNGIIVGTWQRTFSKGKAVVDPHPWMGVSKPKSKALKEAIKRFESFAENSLATDDTPA